MIVADASLIGHAVIPRQHLTLAMACRNRDGAWIAPTVWRYELVNALAKHFRVPDIALRISAVEAILAFELAMTLVSTPDVQPAGEDVLRRAFDLKVSGYDAHYVVLAQRLGVRVVTADRQLLERAAHVCISLEDFAAGR